MFVFVSLPQVKSKSNPICSYNEDTHSNFSSSSMLLTIGTFASSGVPFSLMNILQLLVHVLLIFFILLR